MIQRIQSLWLLLAGVASLLTFKYSVYSGNMVGTDNVKKFVELNATPNFFVLILTVINTAIAFIAIFLFKNRKLQLRLTIIAIVLSIVNLVIYFYETGKFVEAEGKFALTSIVAIAIPIFFVLAARGIYADHKLVKDSDRLR